MDFIETINDNTQISCVLKIFVRCLRNSILNFAPMYLKIAMYCYRKFIFLILFA